VVAEIEYWTRKDVPMLKPSVLGLLNKKPRFGITRTGDCFRVRVV